MVVARLSPAFRLREAAVVLAVLFSTGALAQPVAPSSATRHAPDGFVVATTGDLLGPYGPAYDPDAPSVAKVSALFRGADVGFANEEGNVFDLKSFRGFTGAENGGGYPRHELAVMRGIRSMGITLASHANNHATDWGIEGMRATTAALEAIGIVHAGSGESLDAARAPSFRDTSKGRVALVAAASSFTGNSPAANANRGAGPRPGLNPLHVEAVRLVQAAEFATLQEIASRAGDGSLFQQDPAKAGAQQEVRLDGTLYRASDHGGLTFDVSKPDRDGLVAAVAQARTSADVVLFSIHAHETASGGADDLAPADFEQPLFHDLVDAGADVVVRNGPHSVMGVEIYRGKPIFYGLGSLFFDLPKVLTMASSGPNKQTISIPSSWFEGAVALTTFKDGVASEIRIYPLLLDSAEGPGRGLPHLAQAADAKRILERIQLGSQRFGTAIAIVDGIGIIRPGTDRR